ncbi:unnamed protein product [Somion occarium]|uniref:AB hydrolase-1 domain-containing protein n=1 Tax=Somion occarium TaxID=3059160 RepID=A0ABP1E0M3_9APHY
MATLTNGFLSKAHRFFTYLGVFYAVGILLLGIPTIQRYVLYQHIFRWPLFTDFNIPESSGLAPGKTLNLKLSTSDNITLGAWFILSDGYYQRNFHANGPDVPPITLDVAANALRKRPTILYLHGTAGNRATPSRIHHYSRWTSRLQVNVLAVDYRGFGDSGGQPDEAGLELDAYTAFQWLVDHGSLPMDILIVGHSLGTAVASNLAKRLVQENIKPRGLSLLAPFSSLSVVVETYPLFGVPILQPLQSFSLGRKLMKRLIREEFNTLSILQELNMPIFVAHATSDVEIPHWHSQTLIEHLLNPILPPSLNIPSAPGNTLSEEAFKAYKESMAKRHEARALLVKKKEVEKFGFVEEFEEGVQDEMGQMFGLGAI